MDTKLADKTVLVTGGAGFLGSDVSARFEKVGASVVAPRSRDFDLTRQDATKALFDEAMPDIVVHLAATVGGIGANRVNPGLFFHANMAMGLNVIDESRLHEVEKIVTAGTVCAYPKHTPVPFREEDLWNGYPEETNAPYGIAKKALLVMLQSYRDQYGTNGIYLVPVNLYGPGDNFDLETSHVIPALIRKIAEAKRTGSGHIDAWGTGSASREFLHVDDAARAIVMATKFYDSDEPVNIGTGREITIKDLTYLLIEIIGFEGEVRWDPSKPDGQPRRMLNTDRAREAFGFEAEVSLEEGLRETVEWWLAQPEAQGA